MFYLVRWQEVVFDIHKIKLRIFPVGFSLTSIQYILNVVFGFERMNVVLGLSDGSSVQINRTIKTMTRSGFGTNANQLSLLKIKRNKKIFELM